MLRKISQPLKLKYLTAFAATFMIAVGINAATGNYWFNFRITKTFTKVEAEAKLSKRIVAKCPGDSKALQGTIISYHKNDFSGQVVVEVKWEKPLLGKYTQSNVDKTFYEKCVAEINSGN